MDNAIKVNTTVMYFTDFALLWLHHRSTDERRGGTTIGIWEEFHREFKAQFYLEYAEDKARAKLCRLMQQRTVREYMKEFSVLMFQIFDLGEKEVLHGWAKAVGEIRVATSRGPRTFQSYDRKGVPT